MGNWLGRKRSEKPMKYESQNRRSSAAEFAWFLVTEYLPGYYSNHLCKFYRFFKKNRHLSGTDVENDDAYCFFVFNSYVFIFKTCGLMLSTVKRWRNKSTCSLCMLLESCHRGATKAGRLSSLLICYEWLRLCSKYEIVKYCSKFWNILHTFCAPYFADRTMSLWLVLYRNCDTNLDFVYKHCSWDQNR